MSHDELVALLGTVQRCSSDGARVIFRDLFSRTDLEAVEEATGLRYLRDTSGELSAFDRALVFTVQAFSVVK